MSDSLQVDAALSGPWEVLGASITAHGGEDSSGLRRAVVWAIERGDDKCVQGLVRCSAAEAQRLRLVFVEAWGEPE